jgi:hypothetical protein
MQRIGLAASRMAQGNLLKYNLFVLGISSLFSLFIFFVSGFTILLALLLISIVTRFFLPPEFSASWPEINKISMVALAVIVGFFDMLAVIKNIKFTKTKI